MTLILLAGTAVFVAGILKRDTRNRKKADEALDAYITDLVSKV